MPIPIPSFETIWGWIKAVMPAMKTVRDLITGPAIEAHLLNPVSFVYTLEVKNKGGGVAIPRVFLDDVSDGEGKFIGGVVSPIEINHTGQRGWPRLFGGARALFPILTVDWRYVEGPSLWVDKVEREGIGPNEELVTGGQILIPPTPMVQHKQIQLTIRVVFHSPADPQKELKDRVLTFSVDPLAASGEFRVRWIKARHKSIFQD